MSALDLVGQRPVPARPTGRMGQLGGDTAGGQSGEQPFSAVLSGEERGAASDTGRPRVGGEAGVPANGAEQAEAATAGPQLVDRNPPREPAGEPAQSDDMLALLDSLMSSAAFSDDAKLGVDDLQPEADAVEVAVQDTNIASTAITRADAANTADTNTKAGPEITAGIEANTDTEIDIEDTEVLTNQVAAQASQIPVASADPAVPTRQTKQTGEMAELVASLRTGEPVSAKNAPARTTQDSTKVSTEEKEALRALGLNTATSVIKPDENKSEAGGRFAAADQRSAKSDRTTEAKLDANPRNVEVLESRRFMALHPLSANGQMLSRSLIDAGQPLFAAQRAGPAQPASVPGQPQPGQMLHTLKLQLNPLSLGSVTAVLKLSGEELSVDIKVETIEAYRQLSDDNRAILKSLRSQGYGVEQITIQHVPGPDRTAAQAPQPGFQPGSSGSGSADAQASGKQSGGQGAGQQGNSQNGGRGRDQNSYVGSVAGRADGVYL